jgi:hypothetical protein
VSRRGTSESKRRATQAASRAFELQTRTNSLYRRRARCRMPECLPLMKTFACACHARSTREITPPALRTPHRLHLSVLPQSGCDTSLMRFEPLFAACTSVPMHMPFFAREHRTYRRKPCHGGSGAHGRTVRLLDSSGLPCAARRVRLRTNGPGAARWRPQYRLGSSSHRSGSSRSHLERH